MRILLADDQPSVRKALKLAIEGELGHQIVAEAADAAGLLLEASTGNPDLIIVDWDLPGLPAKVLLPLLRFQLPKVNIIAMSCRLEAEHRALQDGADAFLDMGAPPEQTLKTIAAFLQAPRQPRP